MYDIIELNGKLLADLKGIAKELNIKKLNNLKKQDLIYKILDHQALNPSRRQQKRKKPPNLLTKENRAINEDD